MPLVARHRGRFKRFWLRADAVFGKPELYEYCEEERITYFQRLKSNNTLTHPIQPHLKRPVGRPPKSGIQTKLSDFYYQGGSWDRPWRVICRIEWHVGELFPRIGFIVTNSRPGAGKVVKVYLCRDEIENRIKEGEITLRRDKPSSTRFAAHEARVKIGVLAYNLVHMLRKLHIRGEGGETIHRIADPTVDQRWRNRLLSREAMACTRIIGVSTGSSFPGNLRCRMRRFRPKHIMNG